MSDVAIDDAIVMKDVTGWNFITAYASTPSNSPDKA